MPITLSVLINVFEGAERAKAIGIWTAVAGLGVALGPITGGWLLEHFEWTSVFLVNLPIVAVGVLGGLLLVPESRDPGPRHRRCHSPEGNLVSAEKRPERR